MDALAPIKAVPGLGTPFDRIESIKKGIREFRLWALMQDELDAPFELFIKPKFNTAAWRYDGKRKVHQFFIGTDAINDCGSFEDAVVKVIKLGRHERSHAIRTIRNLDAFQQAIKNAEIPSFTFSDFNLVEDAAIEMQDATEAGEPFGWLEVEKQQPAATPWSLFFNYIQSDGAADVLVEKSKLSESVIREVREFYEQAIIGKDSWTRFEIAKEMAKRFPRKKGDADPGLADLEISGQLSSDESFAQQFIAGCLDEKGKPVKNNTGPTEEEVTADSSKDTNSSNGTVLVEELDYSPNYQALSKLQEKFLSVFSTKKRMRLTDRPTKHLDVREMIQNSDKVFRKREVLAPGKKHIELFVDMSGSMDGTPSQGAHDLIYILNRLAHAGYVKGRVIFSAIGEYGNNSIRETYRLPMPDNKLQFVSGWAGGEGLEGNLKAEIPALQKADYVFVYTDADITDAPIDKAALHRLGIFTVGLYVGSATKSERMLKYFDKAIARPSIDSLIDAMVSLMY